MPVVTPKPVTNASTTNYRSKTRKGLNTTSGRKALMTLTWLVRLRAQPRARFHYRTRCARRGPLPHVAQLEDRCVPSTLTVDGSQHFQSIDGFGTNLSSEAWNSGAIAPSLDTLLSHGYKLYRVIVEPV